MDMATGDPASLPSEENPRTTKERRVEQLRLLWSSRKLLLGSLLLGTIVSTGLALSIPVRYEATAQLMPPDGQAGSGMAMLSALAGRSGGLGGVAGDILGVKNSGALFVGILGSRTVQDRLVEEFDLRRVYGLSKMEDLRQALTSRTHISEDRKSGIISITVTDHEAGRAAAMAEAYVNALNLLVEQVSTSSARRERIFLEERLGSVKQDLDSAAQRFSVFASKNTAIDIPAQSKAMVEAAATLQGQLIAAESELHGLETVYTPQNVRVRSLRARVAELRAQLGKLGGDGSSYSGSAGDSSLYPAIRQLPLLGVTYADLYRQTKIQETVYELLTQQYELAKVEEAKEVPSVKVLDAAVVPTKKSFPPRQLFAEGGTLLAFFATCAWILAKAKWNGIDSEDPGKKFAQEVAGTLRGEVLRVAAAAAMLRPGFTRIASGAAFVPKATDESENEESRKNAALGSAARNSLG
ncbi:MAG TPA: Wzz/FepE/Etk N-terminal domain-containing protein [Candidatus Acidoferrum sp.]|nr:Wzz/FepE/Etk N-terminal domain-containing protein [Candidatus Acidoferrum sp.]